MAFKDETGNRYGRLEVICYHSRSEGKAQHPRFLCRCDCGNEVVVLGTNLRRNHTTSCGCYRDERMSEALQEWREDYTPTDEIGKLYGRLVVNAFAGWIQPDGRPNRISTWKCTCSCGNTVVKRREALQDYSSCGCWFSEKISESSKKHGMTNTPTYRSWMKMKERCYLDSYAEKEFYQDIGITVCERWLNSFENFLEDMGERPEGMTLDRIDFTQAYSPENCRWADLTMQAFNCKKYKTNKTGRTGVHLEKDGTFSARIGYRGEQIFLGNKLSFAEACKLRSAAEIKYYGFTKEQI